MLVSLSPSAFTESNVRIDEFVSQSGLGWRVVNDTVMGGRSSSQAEIDGGVLTFKGVLNTNGGGFVSVRTDPQSWQLADFDRIRMRVRGDGREYQVRLRTRTDRATYSSSHFIGESWQIVEAEFADFNATWRGRTLDRPPLKGRDIDGVGILLADGQDGAFRLQVDWIEFRGPGR